MAVQFISIQGIHSLLAQLDMSAHAVNFKNGLWGCTIKRISTGEVIKEAKPRTLEELRVKKNTWVFRTYPEQIISSASIRYEFNAMIRNGTIKKEIINAYNEAEIAQKAKNQVKTR